MKLLRASGILAREVGGKGLRKATGKGMQRWNEMEGWLGNPYLGKGT